MSITDYTQVAINANIKFSVLNETSLKLKMLNLWRQALVDKVIGQDLDTLRTLKVAKTVIHQWRNTMHS